MNLMNDVHICESKLIPGQIIKITKEQIPGFALVFHDLQFENITLIFCNIETPEQYDDDEMSFKQIDRYWFFWLEQNIQIFLSTEHLEKLKLI